jgi:hypothetical protein
MPSVEILTKIILFLSSLGDVTQGPIDMRESQHEPEVEIRKTQKVAKLY